MLSMKPKVPRAGDRHAHLFRSKTMFVGRYYDGVKPLRIWAIMPGDEAQQQVQGLQDTFTDADLISGDAHFKR